jgi:hypothetical protein
MYDNLLLIDIIGAGARRSNDRDLAGTLMRRSLPMRVLSHRNHRVGSSPIGNELHVGNFCNLRVNGTRVSCVE